MKKSAPGVVQTHYLWIKRSELYSCCTLLTDLSDKKAKLAWLHKRSKALFLGLQVLQLFVVLSLKVVDISLTSDVCILGLSHYSSSTAAGGTKIIFFLSFICQKCLKGSRNTASPESTFNTFKVENAFKNHFD